MVASQIKHDANRQSLSKQVLKGDLRSLWLSPYWPLGKNNWKEVIQCLTNCAP